MSATPGVTGIAELRPVTLAAETAPPAAATQPEGSETGTGANAGLASAIENAMAQSTGNKIDTGFATTAGITPDQIPPAIESAPESVESVIISDASVQATALGETEKNTSPRIFNFVNQAALDLAEAKKRNVSLSEEKEYQVKLDTAISKERLLMSGVHILEIDAEITNAKQNGASKDVLAALDARRTTAVQERNRTYEGVFGQIKNQAKIDKRTFGEAVDGYLLTEAQQIKRDIKSSLEEIEKSGNTEEIALARIRLQAVEMHIEIIERKKRGRGGILAPLAIFVASFTSNIMKSSAGDLQPKGR